CGRYRNASWSADGNSIYGIQIRAGVNELHQLNKNGVKQSVLWRGAVWEVISSLDVSPDGNNLVAALWRKPDGWNLELFSLESFTWRKLTHDSAIEGHPQYSADGQGIIYTSDQNHAFNLHHLDLRTGRSTILSNVRGSALAPHETVSGNIVYLGYSAEGQDIWQLSGSDRINRPVPSLPPGPSGKALFDTPGPVQAEKQPYSAWNSLRPRMWLPWYFFDDQRSELGFSTSGYDSLLRHFYSTTLAYDASNHWPAGYFSYTYDGWYPLFKFQAERTHSFYEITGNVTGRIRRDDNSEIEIAFPFLTMDQRFSVNLGFFTHKNSDVWLDQGVLPIASFTDNVAGLALIYDSSERHIKSISRTSGREIRLLWEDSDALPASNYDGRVRLAEWREFLSLGGEQVLALRLVEGKGSESTRPFRLGGTSDGFSGNGNPLNPFGPSVFNQRRFNLRGYPEGLAALTGQHMRLGSVEYRLPVARIERGFMSPPLGIHQIHATFFYDKGAAWSNRGGPENYYSSSGIEFNADTVFFYSLTMQLAMGYANGREPGGDEKWYLRIGAAF
ncbi:MAG: hypothetical protein OEZ23_09285, partial [Gammaproteobacteria bacterium]|nr:hypothetical protein [Gammaproteobacteria bacterium]